MANSLNIDSRIAEIEKLKAARTVTDAEYAKLLDEQIQLRVKQSAELKKQILQDNKKFKEKAKIRKKIEENEVNLLKELEKGTRKKLESIRVESKASGKTAEEIVDILETQVLNIKKNLKSTIKNIVNNTSISEKDIEYSIKNVKRTKQKQTLVGSADKNKIEEIIEAATKKAVEAELKRESFSSKKTKLKDNNEKFKQEFVKRLENINEELKAASKRSEVTFAKLKLEAIKNSISNNKLEITRKESKLALQKIDESLKLADEKEKNRRKKGVYGLLRDKVQDSGIADKISDYGNSIADTLKDLDPEIGNFIDGIKDLASGISKTVDTAFKIPEYLSKAKELSKKFSTAKEIFKGTEGSLYDKFSAILDENKKDTSELEKIEKESFSTLITKQDETKVILEKIEKSNQENLKINAQKLQNDQYANKESLRDKLILADKTDSPTPDSKAKDPDNAVFSKIKDLGKTALDKSGILDKAKGFLGDNLGTILGSAGGLLAAGKTGILSKAGSLLGKLPFLGKAGAMAGKFLPKLAPKLGASVLKKLPFIGLAAGAGLGINRLLKGDFVGAGGELASGLSSMVPGIGTAGSVAIDSALAYRDANSTIEQPTNNKPVQSSDPNIVKKNQEQFAELIGKEVAKSLQNQMRQMLNYGNRTGGASQDKSARGNNTIKDRQLNPKLRREQKRALKSSQNYMMNQGSSDIGFLTSTSESGNNPGAISNGKDAGGKSYGSYQVSTPTMADFLKKSKFAEELKKSGEVGSKEFDEKWKELARNFPVEFHKDQKEFMMDSHYNPLLQKLNKNGIDLSNRSAGLQSVLFSTATQYGAGGAASTVNAALENKDVNSMSDKEIIDAITNEKINSIDDRFKTSLGMNPGLRPGLENRFERERNEAIALNNKENLGDTTKGNDKSMVMEKLNKENSELKTQVAKTNSEPSNVNIINQTQNSGNPEKQDPYPISLRNPESTFNRNIDNDFCLVS